MGEVRTQKEIGENEQFYRDLFMIGKAVQPGTDDIITMTGISKFIKPKPKRTLFWKWPLKNYAIVCDRLFGHTKTAKGD